MILIFALFGSALGQGQQLSYGYPLPNIQGFNGNSQVQAYQPPPFNPVAADAGPGQAGYGGAPPVQPQLPNQAQTGGQDQYVPPPPVNSVPPEPAINVPPPVEPVAGSGSGQEAYAPPPVSETHGGSGDTAQSGSGAASPSPPDQTGPDSYAPPPVGPDQGTSTGGAETGGQTSGSGSSSQSSGSGTGGGQISCDRKPFKADCGNGRKAQFTLRWFAKDGECWTFPWGHCKGDEIAKENLARTKKACQELCL